MIEAPRRKLIDSVPTVAFGGRPVKVAEVWGQGVIVYDPDRQDGTRQGFVRVWRASTNSELELSVDYCDFEPSSSVSRSSWALRGFSDFLINGPSDEGAFELRYQAAIRFGIAEDDESWEPESERFTDEEADPIQPGPVEYDEDPDDAHWK